MFLKKLFRKTPPPQPTVESFTIESLRERIAKIKTEKIENFRLQFNPMLNEINAAYAALSESLRALSVSDPDENVDAGLVKSATEARKLLFDKVSRATSGISRCSDVTSDAISAFDERLSKAVNLTTDAVKTHGRYVRAVFGEKSLEFESSLRALHELAMRAHMLIGSAIKEIQNLDSIMSEISLQEQMAQDVDKTGENVKSLESRAKDIEDALKDERAQLEALRAGEEFKRATDSARKFEETGREITRLRETAVSFVSEMSRPFRKLEKLVKSGGHSAESEVMRILDVCIYNPIDVISSKENMAIFERLLREAAELASTSKIDLDKRERKNVLDAPQRLVAELGAIRTKLTDLGVLIESQKKAANSPAVEQAVKLETLIKQREYSLSETSAAIEELGKKAELIKRELVSKRENLKKLASEALGVIAEISS
jgi:hypothetical protein